MFEVGGVYTSSKDGRRVGSVYCSHLHCALLLLDFLLTHTVSLGCQRHSTSLVMFVSYSPGKSLDKKTMREVRDLHKFKIFPLSILVWSRLFGVVRYLKCTYPCRPLENTSTTMQSLKRAVGTHKIGSRTFKLVSVSENLWCG